MSAIPASSISAASGAKSAAEGQSGDARVPLCCVVDADASIRHFLSLILHGAGIDTQEFADGNALLAALNRRTPDIVFLNVALESAEAIESVVALGKRGYSGYVQLMSSRGSAVLAHVKSIGDQHRLLMLPPLKKPFETGAVVKILQDLKFGEPPSVAGSHRSRRGLAQWLDRILVSAEDRPAQETAGRRRGVRPRPPPAKRRADAERLHAGGGRGKPDQALRTGPGACAQGLRSASPSSA